MADSSGHGVAPGQHLYKIPPSTYTEQGKVTDL
jgi:hypothetical protein